jgi:transposase InsO family protein
MKDSAPRRFKFTLRDDVNFNYEIIVDVMSIEGKSVLHVVDAATVFQGARFLPTMSAKDTWETLKMLWIDTYQGPPDIITYDAGTNFASAEFRAEAKLIGIRCKQVPVEAHHSIGKVERYHAPLRRAFEILFAELSSIMKIDSILQMAVKAVNDTAGPDGLVPILLVFGTYPRINADSQPSPTMVKRAEAIQKAMKELRRLRAERQVNNALNTRNGPEVTDTINLPL